MTVLQKTLSSSQISFIARFHIVSKHIQSLMASLRLFRSKINSSSFLAVSLISPSNVVWRGFMSFCDFKVFLSSLFSVGFAPPLYLPVVDISSVVVCKPVLSIGLFEETV